MRGLENNPKIETRKDGTNQWKKSNLLKLQSWYWITFIMLHIPGKFNIHSNLLICTYLAHNCVIWHCQLQSRNHICSSDFFEYLLIWRMGPDNDRTWRQTFSNCKREDQWYASVKRYPFPTNSDKGIPHCYFTRLNLNKMGPL